jgi:hypothetical protein
MTNDQCKSYRQKITLNISAGQPMIYFCQSKLVDILSFQTVTEMFVFKKSSMLVIFRLRPLLLEWIGRVFHFLRRSKYPASCSRLGVYKLESVRYAARQLKIFWSSSKTSRENKSALVTAGSQRNIILIGIMASPSVQSSEAVIVNTTQCIQIVLKHSESIDGHHWYFCIPKRWTSVA